MSKKGRIQDVVDHLVWAAKNKCPQCEGTALVKGKWCKDCGATGIKKDAAR